MLQTGLHTDDTSAKKIQYIFVSNIKEPYSMDTNIIPIFFVLSVNTSLLEASVGDSIPQPLPPQLLPSPLSISNPNY